MVNQSPETFQHHLREIELGPNYHPKLTGHKIQEACMRQLCLAM